MSIDRVPSINYKRSNPATEMPTIRHFSAEPELSPQSDFQFAKVWPIPFNIPEFQSLLLQ
jgi:hypothetical protein